MSGGHPQKKSASGGTFWIGIAIRGPWLQIPFSKRVFGRLLVLTSQPPPARQQLECQIRPPTRLHSVRSSPQLVPRYYGGNMQMEGESSARI